MQSSPLIRHRQRRTGPITSHGENVTFVCATTSCTIKTAAKHTSILDAMPNDVPKIDLAAPDARRNRFVSSEPDTLLYDIILVTHNDVLGLQAFRPCHHAVQNPSSFLACNASTASFSCAIFPELRLGRVVQPQHSQLNAIALRVCHGCRAAVGRRTAEGRADTGSRVWVRTLQPCIRFRYCSQLLQCTATTLQVRKLFRSIDLEIV